MSGSQYMYTSQLVNLAKVEKKVRIQPQTNESIDVCLTMDVCIHGLWLHGEKRMISKDQSMCPTSFTGITKFERLSIIVWKKIIHCSFNSKVCLPMMISKIDIHEEANFLPFSKFCPGFDQRQVHVPRFVSHEKVVQNPIVIVIMQLWL